ncbi:hypothetical protein ACFFJ4_03665, partial [Xanthomonas dyei]
MNAFGTLRTATFRIAGPVLFLLLGSISTAHANTEEDGRYWLSIYAQGKLPVENLGIPTFLRYQAHLLAHCVGQGAQA